VLTSANPRLQIASQYDGPRCPRCNQKLTADWIRSGIVKCPDCSRTFEATAFDPPTRTLHVADVATAGPQASNVCANHSRNVATTNCARCGLFICALCEMNVGTGSYCPACFERMRSEGKVGGQRRRAYPAMARISAIAGIFFTFILIGPLFGILSMVYNHRARKDRIAYAETPVWTGGMIVVEILAVLVVVGGTLLDVFMVAGLVMGRK
jgi:uncharacterized paraquat-inducible protein A